MKINISRIDLTIYSKYFYSLYTKNREFFRRVPPDLRKEDILNIESICQGNFYILVDEKDKEPIGLAFLTQIDNNGLSCHIGLILDQEYQDHRLEDGNKVAYYAVKDFIQYIFTNTHLRKVSLRFLKSREDIENSLILAGFHKEAEFKESVYHQGYFQDEIEYAIFKEKFLSLYCHK